MARNYKVQRNSKHVAKQYPKTLKAFGTFIISASTTAVAYGIITSPYIASASEEILARDSAGNILLVFGTLTVLSGLDVIKKFKLERKQKKLQAKLARQEARMSAEDDLRELYERIEAQKRFENIVEQTKGF